jgi:stage II sporulation protein R
MGKKRGIFIILAILVMTLGFLKGQATVANAAMNPGGEIPEESIRLRILANSNSDVDQNIKRMIRDEVNLNITEWVGDLASIDTARTIIQNHLDDIRKTVEANLEKYNIDETFSVEFGMVSFPTKIYGEYVYPAGEYEAVLITLGEGVGNNWWCVLFPPLCFLDFENGDAVQKNESKETTQKQVTQEVAVSKIGDQAKVASSENIEVKFFLVEWATKLIDTITSWSA